MELLLNTVALPEFPDWVIDLPNSLPETFSGKALVLVGLTEVVVAWDFSSVIISDLLERLGLNGELDTVSAWGPSNLQAWVQGNETTATGLIGIMVER
ncbi:MAG TPA: hypothetical protein PLY87_09005 [Planctomycetaceae bacterium]|nr:hypothetical protein [Planctomycetaceae bacterium]